jgi:hypothetical protein
MPNNTESEVIENQKESLKRKSPFKAVFLLLIVVVSALVLIFKDRVLTILKLNTDPISPPHDLVEETRENPFGDFLDSQEEGDFIGEINYDNLDSTFQEEILPITLKQGVFIDWEKESSLYQGWIFGQIESLNDNSMIILITKPENIGTKSVIYTCKEEKSIILAKENLEVLGTHIEVSKIAKPGYLLYTKCLNEDCTELGDSCVLVKMD